MRGNHPAGRSKTPSRKRPTSVAPIGPTDRLAQDVRNPKDFNLEAIASLTGPGLPSPVLRGGLLGKADRDGQSLAPLLCMWCNAAQEMERRRMSWELHDDLGQLLTAIILGLKTLEVARENPTEHRKQSRRLRAIAQEAITSVRRIVQGLRPRALDEMGLTVALEGLAREFKNQYGTRVELNADGTRGLHLPSHVETAIFRIVQESLANAGRHAHARSVAVRLFQGPRKVRVVVKDDGDGFNPSAKPDPGETHFGLKGMRGRVQAAGGTLSLRTHPRSGTTVTAEFPLGAPTPPSSDSRPTNRF